MTAEDADSADGVRTVREIESPTGCPVLLATLAVVAVFAAFSTILTAPPVRAQIGVSDSEIGRPFITNYHPTEYGASVQNWAVVQDDRGIMYFGNNSGVLEYDGATWRLIEVPNRTVIRSLAKAEDGRIYVGAVGDLGYLEADSLGQMQFVSLRPSVPESYRDFADVWTVDVIGSDAYFTTSDYIFRWHGDSMRTWQAEESFHVADVVDSTYYVRQWGFGLMRLEGEDLRLVPGGERFAQDRIYVTLPFGDGRILIGTRSQGLFLFDPSATGEGEVLTPFETEIDDALLQGGLYLPGAVLPGGRFVLGTFSGLYVIDSEGRRLQYVDRTAGLQDNVILFTYVDREEALWLGLDNGLARVEIDAPLSYYGAADGLASNVLSLERHDGVLYAGTSTGLFRLDAAERRFREIEGGGLQVFSLLSVDGDLLVASFDGLQRLAGDGTEFIQRSEAGAFVTNRLHRSKQEPSRVFVSATTHGLATVRRSETGTWMLEGSVPGTDVEIWSIAEPEAGTIWAGTTANGVLRVHFPQTEGTPGLEDAEVTAFASEHGLPTSTIQVATTGNAPIFMTKEGLFRFDPETERFSRDSTTFAGIQVGGDPEEWFIREDEEGRVWLNFGRETAVAHPLPDGSYRIDTAPFRRFAGTTLGAIHPDLEGTVWLGLMERLVRLDMVDAAEEEEYPVLIRRVATTEGRLLYGGAGEMMRPELPYRDRSLRFEVAAPRFVEAGRTEYQVMLDGFDSHPSAWTREAMKEYTNLPPGNYTFRVKARDVNGQESTGAAYAFRVMAPWYGTPWAYLLYLLIAAGVAVALVRTRTRHLEARSRELEQIVHERTVELEQRVEELAVITSVQRGLVAELDMQAIYDLVGERIRHFFDAQIVSIATFDHASGLEHLQYLIEKDERISHPPRPIDLFRRRLIETRTPILISENFVEVIVDAGIERPEPLPGTELPKSVLFVPLVVGETVKGYVSLQNVDREHAFAESDLRLLSTLANSMSVALENARLFAETNRLLDETEQRAAELAVINSVQEGLVAELDMQAIYDLVGDRVRDLFDAQVVVIRTFDHEKGSEHIHYAFEKGRRFYMDPMPADSFTRHLMATREPILINGDFAGYIREFDDSSDTAVGEAPRSALFVPMIVGDSVRGNVSLQNVDRENAFTQADVRLLSTLANSMSVALENARLFAETRQQATELDTVNRVSRALVAQLDFDALIRLVGEQMRKTFEADIVYVALLDRDDGTIHFPYAYGEELKPMAFGEGLTSRVIRTGEPLLINEDVRGRTAQMGIEKIGIQAASYLGVPIHAGRDVVGVISVQTTERENVFDADDLRLLNTIAANVGVALQNAEAYQRLNTALAELKRTQTQLVQQEKLASLGALTAGIAHEIKNPLNFINNFAGLNVELVDEIAEGLSEHPAARQAIQDILEDLRTSASKIEEHGRRADGIVKSMLEHSRGTKGERRPVDLNALVEEYVNLAYHGKRAQQQGFNATVERQYGEGLNAVELVPQEIGRVVLNLVGNAFDAVTEQAARLNGIGDGQYAPTVTVSTRRTGARVELRVADNGTGVPASVREKVFEPFFTTKMSGDGTGLGLSLSYDIVTQGHGGTMTLESEEGKGAAFVVTLPLTYSEAEPAVGESKPMTDLGRRAR